MFIPKQNVQLYALVKWDAVFWWQGRWPIEFKLLLLRGQIILNSVVQISLLPAVCPIVSLCTNCFFWVPYQMAWRLELAIASGASTYITQHIFSGNNTRAFYSSEGSISCCPAFERYSCRTCKILEDENPWALVWISLYCSKDHLITRLELVS